MLTFGYFLARTADLLAPAIKRASATDADGNVLGVNAEAPEQRAALIAALGKTPIYAPSGKAPVVAQRTTPGVVGPFRPLPGRPFNITIAGGVAVSAQIERSFDGGATKFVKTRDIDRQNLPETFSDSEPEDGVDYFVNVTAIESGTVTVRFSV